MSIVGAVFALLVGWCLLQRPDLLPWVLSASSALLATAGLVLAGQSILTYYPVAMVLIASAAARTRISELLSADLRIRTGLSSLLAFGTWSLIVTAVGPVLFAGTPVLNPRDGIDAGVEDPAELTPQISNLAQSIYLVVGILTVVALGMMPRLSPRLPAAGFAVGTSLSSLRSLLPQSVQRAVFDNSGNVTYTAGSVDGVERMRGIFSEPSSLGAFSITATVFFVMTASRTRRWRRYLSLGMAIWSLVNASLSGSGTALVGGLAVLAVITTQAVHNYLAGGSRVSSSALVAALLAVPSAIMAGPTLYAVTTAMIGDKVDSSSYANRSTADRFSVDLSVETYGFGVGVGANRPSSFLTMLLSCTGVLGVALFVVGFLTILFGALRHRDFQPTAWALFALMFSKVVAGPDLSDPTMWFLLAVCANAAWRGRPVAGRCSEQAVTTTRGHPISLLAARPDAPAT